MTTINAGARERLRRFVERVENLNEKKASLTDDIKVVFAEAKATGFDVKTLRKIIALRKQDPHERQEQQALLETYMSALGMQGDLFENGAEPKPEGAVDEGTVVPLKISEMEPAE